MHVSLVKPDGHLPLPRQTTCQFSSLSCRTIFCCLPEACIIFDIICFHDASTLYAYARIHSSAASAILEIRAEHTVQIDAEQLCKTASIKKIMACNFLKKSPPGVVNSCHIPSNGEWVRVSALKVHRRVAQSNNILMF